MLEIEAKVWLDKHNIKYEDILKKLQKEYKFIGEKNKSDIYFTKNNEDIIFRIRDCNNKYIVTNKIQTHNGNIEINKENEIIVDNKENFIKLTEFLGYEILITKEKHTIEFEKDDCTIELNKVNSLGNFLEIEYVCEDCVDKIKAMKKIENIFKKLGFNKTQFETKRYIDLIKEKQWKQS